MSDNNRNLSSNSRRKLGVVIKEWTHYLNEEQKYNKRTYPSLTPPVEGAHYINSFASIYSTLEERQLQEAIIEYDYLEDDHHNKYINAWLNYLNCPALQENDADTYTDTWIEAGGGISHIQHHPIDASVQTPDNPFVDRAEIVISTSVAQTGNVIAGPSVAHTDDVAKVEPFAPYPDNAQGDIGVLAGPSVIHTDNVQGDSGNFVGPSVPQVDNTRGDTDTLDNSSTVHTDNAQGDTGNLAGPSVPHVDDTRDDTGILVNPSVVSTDNTHGDTDIPVNPQQVSTTQITVDLLPPEVAKNVGWNSECRFTIQNWWNGTTTNLPTTSKNENAGHSNEKDLVDTSNNTDWNTNNNLLDTGDEGTGWRDSDWSAFNDNTMGRSSTEKSLIDTGDDNANRNPDSTLVDTGDDTNWNITDNKLIDTGDATKCNTKNDNKWLPLTTQEENTASWKKHFIEPQEEQEEQDLINFNANGTADVETKDNAPHHPDVQTLIDSATTCKSYHTAPEYFTDTDAEGSNAVIGGGNAESSWVPIVDCHNCIKYTRSKLFDILNSMPTTNTKLGTVAGRLLKIYFFVKTDKKYDPDFAKADAEDGGVGNLVDCVMQLGCCPSRQPKGPPNKEAAGFSPGLPRHEGTQKCCVICKTKHT